MFVCVYCLFFIIGREKTSIQTCVFYCFQVIQATVTSPERPMALAVEQEQLTELAEVAEVAEEVEVRL